MKALRNFKPLNTLESLDAAEHRGKYCGMCIHFEACFVSREHRLCFSYKKVAETKGE